MRLRFLTIAFLLFYCVTTPLQTWMILFNNVLPCGVILADNGKFEEHIEKVTRTVRPKVGWVMKTFFTRRTDIMKQLWKTLIQCHIDY